MSTTVQIGLVEVVSTSRVGNAVVQAVSSRKITDYQEMTPGAESAPSSVVASAGIVGSRPDQFLWFISVGQEAGEVHAAFGPAPVASATNGPKLGPGDHFRSVHQVGDTVAIIQAG